MTANLDYVPLREKRCLRVTCLLSILLFLLVSGRVGAVESEPDASGRELNQLISNLGAPEFSVREFATNRLFELGRGEQGERIVRRLAEVSAGGDRESHERAERVLTLLRQQRRKQTLTAFLKGSGASEIPGWGAFAVRHGDSEVSRRIYSLMLETEWEMLEKCFSVNAKSTEPSDVAAFRVAANRRFAVANKGAFGSRSTSPWTTLAFCFLGAEYPQQFELHQEVFQLLGGATGMRSYLKSNVTSAGGESALVRSVVGEWLVAASTQNDGRWEATAMMFSLSNGMFAQAKHIAEIVLKNEDSLLPTKRLAMQTFAGMKDVRGIKLIEPYLKDERLLRPKTLQLRDVALACLMDLNGHDVEKIGVKRVDRSRNPYNYNPYEYNSLGFKTEADRAKAFDIFQELQAEKEFQLRQREKKARDASSSENSQSAPLP